VHTYRDEASRSSSEAAYLVDGDNNWYESWNNKKRLN
jgi:hypothetical protein